MGGENQTRTIEVLPADVARRIAAGEVIERPASVVRELIDNSIDAGASVVEIRWEGGGIESILVRDDGGGMGREDLVLCRHEHATSKIRTIEDLNHTRSLGFRGEALSSISAVSELTITSALPSQTHANRLRVDFGEERAIEPIAAPPGTTVEVRRLFANLPARRRFLSRATAESTAIRNTVFDKALPVPEIRFSYGSTDRPPRVLPPASLLERVAAVFGDRVPAPRLHEVTGGGEGFTLKIVAAEPEIARRDRRLIQTFVNGRRVWEYKLIQGIEYAYQDVQHGGLYPAVALLVDIDPELVDFNIHPAKREARIRNVAELRGRVVELLRSFLRAWVVKRVQLGEELWERPGAGGSGSQGGFGSPNSMDGSGHGLGSDSRHGSRRGSSSDTKRGYGDSNYAGGSRRGPGSTSESGFRRAPSGSNGEPGSGGSDTEYGSRRPTGRITRDGSDSEFGSRRGAGTVPFHHERRAVPEVSPPGVGPEGAPPTGERGAEAVPTAEGYSTPSTSAHLHYVGTLFDTFVIVEAGDRSYVIDQHAAHERILYDKFAAARSSQGLLVPEEFEVTEDQDAALERHRGEYAELGIAIERAEPGRWKLTALPPEYREQTEDLIETITELGGLDEELDREFLAEIACKAAIRAGDYLDEISALELARRTLALPTPRCPHGRPLWLELDRESLERLIGRR